MYTNKPPKNREFLGYVKSEKPYWEIFRWTTKAEGLPKAEYTDRAYFNMPELIGWAELPAVE